MKVARWQLALRIAALTAGPLACAEPVFMDERAERDAASDEQREAMAAEAPDEEHDAASNHGRDHDADSPSTLSDAAQTASSDGATLPIPDAGRGAADAGTNGGTEDAAASTLPDWAAPLIGTYAKRSVTFSYDDATPPPFNTRNVEDAIVTISPKGEGLELSIRLCRYEVQLKGSLLPFYLKNATALPPITGRILLGSVGTFSSEGMTRQFGFDRSRADCDGGALRKKYTDQTWITSSTMCECSAARLPDALSDCRIMDGDGDGRAGITGRGPLGIGAVSSEVLMTLESTLTLTDGKIMSDRNHTFREARSQAQSCLDPARDFCSFGANRLCPGGTSKLVPREQVTCATFPEADFGALPDYPAEVDCRAPGS